MREACKVLSIKSEETQIKDAAHDLLEACEKAIDFMTQDKQIPRHEVLDALVLAVWKAKGRS